MCLGFQNTLYAMDLRINGVYTFYPIGDILIPRNADEIFLLATTLQTMFQFKVGS
jgi:hypothetical protein